jgi:hypothetical protein
LTTSGICPLAITKSALERGFFSLQAIRVQKTIAIDRVILIVLYIIVAYDFFVVIHQFLVINEPGIVNGFFI